MSLFREMLKSYYDLDDSTKLSIDTAIQVLANENKLTGEELAVVVMLKNGGCRAETARSLGMSSGTLKRRIREVCNKLANYLGPNYQDSKILEQVKFKLGRELTEEERKYCLYVLKIGKTPKGTNVLDFRIVEGRFISNEDDKAEG